LNSQASCLRAHRGKVLYNALLFVEWRKENNMNFPIIKTVTIGGFKDILDYRKALFNSGFRISLEADRILKKVKLVKKKTELDLVSATVGELSFAIHGSSRELFPSYVFSAIRNLGYKLCPAEIGPASRLVLPESLFGTIASKPNFDGCNAWLFYIGYHSLDTTECILFLREERLIFVQPRK